jgi:hypothetical protein
VVGILRRRLACIKQLLTPPYSGEKFHRKGGVVNSGCTQARRRLVCRVSKSKDRQFKTACKSNLDHQTLSINIYLLVKFLNSKMSSTIINRFISNFGLFF